MTLNEESMLSTKEIADFCNVSTRTVQRWINKGHLIATKVGPKVWRIKESDFKYFINNKEDLHGDRNT